MREITTHRVKENPREFIQIYPEGDPVIGAPPTYRLLLLAPGQREYGKEISLRFQSAAATPDGLTNEALLAVVIDRLQEFQKGRLSCWENATALTHLETALLWLQKRTRDRVAREVEGTMDR
jgi:hypothetical protein